MMLFHDCLHFCILTAGEIKSQESRSIDLGRRRRPAALRCRLCIQTSGREAESEAGPENAVVDVKWLKKGEAGVGDGRRSLSGR
jgi:hypothetical protein